MDRGISKQLWQFLRPDIEGWTPFSEQSPRIASRKFFDDFCGEGYVDNETGGWTPFDTLELESVSQIAISDATRIVIEGRFRPQDEPATLLLWFTHDQSIYLRIQQNTKVGVAIDGSSRTVSTYIDGKGGKDAVDVRASSIRVRCVAIGGLLECDWLACAEVQA